MKHNRLLFNRWHFIAIVLFIFNYAGNAQFTVKSEAQIKIGLLIGKKEALAAVRGAELAISISNKGGGSGNKSFDLVVRSMEGPWGTGSKQAVDLIFEENVWALLGSHDGRNAHLVEQAATKSQIVFVSAWSGDPSLSQAFVPWFFNTVPNDLQQAGAFIEEIYLRRKLNRVIIIRDDLYDSKQSFNSFMREIKGRNIPEPRIINSDGKAVDNLAGRIEDYNPECMILFCSPQFSAKLTGNLQNNKIRIPVFGPLSLLNEDELSENEIEIIGNSVLFPSGNWTEPIARIFIKEYTKKFGKSPGMVAAYAFDAMNLIIEAIKVSGSNEREKIQKALSEISLEGVTGRIRFDKMGNRSDKIQIINVKKGIPATLIF